MRIYLETSVISYLAARPSTDAIKASRQHFSYRLWQLRERIPLFISQAVLTEAGLGDPEAIQSRLAYCDQLPQLSLNAQVTQIVEHLLNTKAIPPKAYTDAVHIAIAAAHDVRFIASWNFRHIVGALPRRRIEQALSSIMTNVPVIATPEEISESIL